MEQPRVKGSRSYSTKPPWKDALNMSFAQAIDVLLAGRKITKLEWNDTTIYGELRNGILMLHRDDEWFQWIISEADLQGADWVGEFLDSHLSQSSSVS